MDERGQATTAVSAISFRPTADISYVASVFRSHISSATLTTSLPDPAHGECLVSRNRPATKMGNRIYRRQVVGSLSQMEQRENIRTLRSCPYKTIHANDTNKSCSTPTSSGASLNVASYSRRESDGAGGDICHENHCDIACHKSLSVWCTANTGP